jgi:hypothetical protein
MGLKLTFLSWWMPSYFLNRELTAVAEATNKVLKETIQLHNAGAIIETETLESVKGINEKRSAMAKQHAVLVDTLVEELGQETAVKLGRETLYKVGEQLGKQSRDRLGVGDSPEDLVKAAKIMYRVLGIHFKVDWSTSTQATLTVNRCALAKNYSELTCQVLSATDEGVVHGLNPNINMKFQSHLTGGCKVCTAKIERRTQV